MPYNGQLIIAHTFLRNRQNYGPVVANFHSVCGIFHEDAFLGSFKKIQSRFSKFYPILKYWE